MSGRLNGITDAQLELIYSELSRLNLQIHITRSLYWRVIAASARLDNNTFIVSGWRPNLRNTHSIFLVHTLWSVLFYNPRFHVRVMTICALHVQIRRCVLHCCLSEAPRATQLVLLMWSARDSAYNEDKSSSVLKCSNELTTQYSDVRIPKHFFVRQTPLSKSIFFKSPWNFKLIFQ